MVANVMLIVHIPETSPQWWRLVLKAVRYHSAFEQKIFSMQGSAKASSKLDWQVLRLYFADLMPRKPCKILE